MLTSNELTLRKSVQIRHILLVTVTNHPKGSSDLEAGGSRHCNRVLFETRQQLWECNKVGVGQSESSHSLAAKMIPDGWNGLLMVSCTPINVLYMWVIMSHTVLLTIIIIYWNQGSAATPQLHAILLLPPWILIVSLQKNITYSIYSSHNLVILYNLILVVKICQSPMYCLKPPQSVDAAVSKCLRWSDRR